MRIKKDYYNSKQAAKILNVDSTTITRWCRAGKIEAIQDDVSKCWFIKKEYIDNF